jgi:hypothetical protein
MFCAKTYCAGRLKPFRNLGELQHSFYREGEAPAEPLRRQLGRSLALPFEPLAGSFQSDARLSRDSQAIAGKSVCLVASATSIGCTGVTQQHIRYTLNSYTLNRRLVDLTFLPNQP